jgi:hypothetical protein
LAHVVEGPVPLVYFWVVSAIIVLETRELKENVIVELPVELTVPSQSSSAP